MARTARARGTGRRGRSRRGASRRRATGSGWSWRAPLAPTRSAASPSAWRWPGWASATSMTCSCCGGEANRHPLRGSRGSTGSHLLPPPSRLDAAVPPTRARRCPPYRGGQQCPVFEALRHPEAPLFFTHSPQCLPRRAKPGWYAVSQAAPSCSCGAPGFRRRAAFPVMSRRKGSVDRWEVVGVDSL